MTHAFAFGSHVEPDAQSSLVAHAVEVLDSLFAGAP